MIWLHYLWGLATCNGCSLTSIGARVHSYREWDLTRTLAEIVSQNGYMIFRSTMHTCLEACIPMQKTLVAVHISCQTGISPSNLTVKSGDFEVFVIYKGATILCIYIHMSYAYTYWDLHLMWAVTFTKIVISYVRNGLKFDFWFNLNKWIITTGPPIFSVMVDDDDRSPRKKFISNWILYKNKIHG